MTVVECVSCGGWQLWKSNWTHLSWLDEDKTSCQSWVAISLHLRRIWAKPACNWASRVKLAFKLPIQMIIFDKMNLSGVYSSTPPHFWYGSAVSWMTYCIKRGSLNRLWLKSAFDHLVEQGEMYFQCTLKHPSGTCRNFISLARICLPNQQSEFMFKLPCYYCTTGYTRWHEGSVK